MIADRQSQANIPEGMIPQEVVARNRNRFMHNEILQKNNLESKPEIKNESPTKDDDSDDGYKNYILNRIVPYRETIKKTRYVLFEIRHLNNVTILQTNRDDNIFR